MNNMDDLYILVYLFEVFFTLLLIIVLACVEITTLKKVMIFIGVSSIVLFLLCYTLPRLIA